MDQALSLDNAWPNASPRPPEPAWPPGVILLCTQLALARDAKLRREVISLYTRRPRPQGPALISDLTPLLHEVLLDSARELGEGLGLTATEVLRFSEPNGTEGELRSERAVLRRLDRIWGGPGLLCLEALRPVRFHWPGPNPGSLVPISGAAQVAGRPVPLFGPIQAVNGTELQFGPQSLVMIRRQPVGALLEATQAAGLSLSRWIEDLAIRTAVPTPVGEIQIEGLVASINGRSFRLSASEARLLRHLADRPGQPIARPQLAEAAGLSGPRALDRMVTDLRNKVGDGVIATVYGVGYALEF